jgi:cytochrome c peroxidase
MRVHLILAGAALVATATGFAMPRSAPTAIPDQRLEAFRRPTEVPSPADNTPTRARIELGQKLFFDPRLSGSDWISCASCHNPALSWGDGLPRAIGNGMKVLGRRTPTILNLAWAGPVFWDGRAETLEEQALGPIGAPGEMGMTVADLPGKLSRIPGYVRQFEAAYPGEGVTLAAVAKAIAAYERTVVSAEAPFDRWVGGDNGAISASAKRGFDLFTGKARCAQCHAGWRFTDDGFYDIGVLSEDKGRGVVLPQIASVQYAFKTPTLRNVESRAPYLHDGSEPTLESVIEFYDQGGKAHRPSQSAEVRPLGLSGAEKRDLRAFLATLTSVDPGVTIPSLPR